MPKEVFSTSSARSVPLVVLNQKEFGGWQRQLSSTQKAWVKSTGFSAAVGTHCLISGSDGKLVMVAVGAELVSLWDWSAIAKSMPQRRFRLQVGPDPREPDSDQATQAALGWALAGYAYTIYKAGYKAGKNKDAAAVLVWPKQADRKYVLACAEAVELTRDLINAPANDMTPADIARVARQLAKSHKARFKTIVGEQLLKDNFPAIHAVGRASSVAPRLIDMTWGKSTHPKVTLVGKGVCFDSGGLDIKSAAGMKIMKKDMGGAAHVLGLASMIMALKLPVRLRILIPAVENSISGNAMRPGDVVPTRKGLTIEIGNTDAEGRVILADALALASGENPEMIVDFATLTGAARVALGTEVPALFCNDDDLASDILESSVVTGDPLWRMPLWAGYKAQVTGKVADLNNAPDGGYGGAITAALFLENFVQRNKGAAPSWAHIDLMAWNLSSRPGRPEGGEAMGLRALYHCIASRF